MVRDLCGILFDELLPFSTMWDARWRVGISSINAHIFVGDRVALLQSDHPGANRVTLQMEYNKRKE